MFKLFLCFITSFGEIYLHAFGSDMCHHSVNFSWVQLLSVHNSQVNLVATTIQTVRLTRGNLC